MEEHKLLIDIKDLTWGYPDSLSTVFHDLNFYLYKNDFKVVMWRSWSWKTTLAKIISWELKTPQRKVFYKRDDLMRYSHNEIQLYKRKIWFIFQDYKLIEDLNVKDNVTYPLNLYGVHKSIVEKKYIEMRNLLWLHNIEDSLVKFISWWEKQKVAIARAMVHNPKFIIADEPTWNLDWEHTQQIADLLINSHKQWNTVLLITHDIHLLEYLKLKHKISLFNL